MRAILSIVPDMAGIGEGACRSGRSRALRATVISAMLLAIASCTTGAVGADSPDEVTVVASFYPLAYAADQVGDDAVTVTNLTPPGVEPHDLEVTSKDLEAIAGADVIVYLGGGFQPAVEEAVASEASGVIVDALEATPSADPHLWLDPGSFANVVERVAAALGEASSADADAFAANADDLEARLAKLDDEFEQGLADCKIRVIITNHAAFGALAAAYDLEQRSISGLSPESEPDPARIAELAEEARAEGVTTIFTEDLVSSEVAETLAAEAGLETAVLSPLEGLTEEQTATGDDYLSVMRRNLETLRDGLVCT